MEKKKLRKKRNSLVVKHNELLRNTRYELSTTEQKILIYLVSKINKDDKELRKVNFDLKEYCEIAGIQTGGEAYIRLKETIRDLSNKSWWIQIDEDHERLFRWIYGEPEIDKRSGVIEIELSPTLEPYLIGLQANFTKYELINVLTLRSSNSIRLYELFKSYLWQHHWKIEVEDFRRLLNIENKYKEFKNLNRQVIKPALEEINEYTDLVVKVETIREGKTTKYLDFTIDEKQGYQLTMDWLLAQEERLGGVISLTE